jgi:hypothetical protein
MAAFTRVSRSDIARHGRIRLGPAIGSTPMLLLAGLCRALMGGMVPRLLAILTGRNLPKIWEWNCGFSPGSRPGWCLSSFHISAN